MVRESYSRRTPAATVHEAIGYRYDAGGRLIAQAMGTRPAATGTFAYGGSGLGVTWMRYNSFGEMTDRGMTALTSESPAYPVDTGRYQERFDYDAGGRLWRTRTGDGIVRILFYDKTGNQTLSLVSSSVNLLATTQVDAGNGITAAGTSGIDDSITTITLYDKRGMQTGTVEPLRKHSSAAAANITRTRLYNAFGEVRSETDGRNYATTFEYNMLGRLTKKTSPQVSVTGETSMTATDVNPVENYAYDISGRLVGVQDANGNWTTRTLLAGTGHEGGATGGSGALVVKEFQPDESASVAGGIVWNKYDVFGDLRVTVDEVGKPIQYGYDKMGRLVKLTHAVRPANTAGNPTGTAVQLIDLYAYDGLGQRIFNWNSQYFANDLDPTDVPSSTNLSKTTYDAAGRVIAMMTMGNQLTNYAYVWDGAATVAGSGVMGGWHKTTTNALSLTMQETTDYFGHDTGGSDFGLHVHGYSYDRLYRLTARTTTTHGANESIAYTWFNTGQVAGQTGTKGIATYEYDKDGRRTKEAFTKGSTMYRSATATYDAVGRMRTWTDFGSTGNTLPDASIAWSYDAQGNVRRTVATYQSLDSQGNPVSATPQDYWYRYDKMNRVITSRGMFDTATSTIKRGTGEGRDIAYDKAGQRTSMIYSKADSGSWDYPINSITHTREDYVYSADGYLAQVRTATASYYATYGGAGDGGAPTGASTVTASYVRDAMGRTTAYNEGTAYSQTTLYNAASQIIGQDTTTVRSDATYVAVVDNFYDAVGNVTSSTNHTAKLGFNDGPPNNKTTYTYEWWDGALQDTIVYDRDTGDPYNVTWDTDLSYDGSGHVISSDIDDDRDRTVTFVTDANGMIVNRDEVDNLEPPSNDPQANGDPRDIRYFFNGRQLGNVTNNGTDNTDYAFSVEQHLETPGYGAFAGGATRGTPYAAFAENYDAINGFDSNNAAFRYTVHAGDTLASIATTLWGDASLWYMIAEANGLMGDETLVEGQSIIIPDKVHNIHNNASTFTPYDPNAAIGDNSPTDPRIPKKKGCGVIGLIILAVVAVAVAAIAGPAIIGTVAGVSASGSAVAATGLTAILGGAGAAAGSAAAIGAAVIGGALAGAAGSIVSQGLGVATGLQDKFSWKAVGLAAIGGGVGGGLQGVNAFGASGLGKLTNVANDFARGALSSSLTQSIGVVTGLQKKLDWAGIAAAGVGLAVGGAINRGLADGGLGVRGDRVGAFTHKDVAFYANGALSGMAGAITNAATRSAISGTNFGDNIMAALPDAIAATIGNLIGDSLNVTAAEEQASRLQAVYAEQGVELSRGDALAGAEGLAIAESRGLQSFDQSIDVLSGSEAARTSLLEVIDVNTMDRADPALANEARLSYLENVLRAPPEALRESRAVYGRFGIGNSGPALDFSSTGSLAFDVDAYLASTTPANTLSDIVVTGDPDDPGAWVLGSFGRWADSAPIKAGQVAKYVSDSIAERPWLEYTLTGLAIVGGPIKWAASELVGKVLGDQIAKLADKAVNLVGDRYIAKDYTPEQAAWAGVGAFSIAAIVIGAAVLPARQVIGLVKGLVSKAPKFVAGFAAKAKAFGNRFVPTQRMGHRTAFDPGGCFVAGTLIHAQDGAKPIEGIVIGDYVLSQPEATGERAWRRVIDTFIHEDKSILRVTCIDSWGATEVVEATFLHPFYVKGIGWTGAEYLEVGHVLELSDGRDARVVSVEDTGRNERVYNFTVDGFHTYYVGTLGVWVHNVDDCGMPVPSGANPKSNVNGNSRNSQKPQHGYEIFDSQTGDVAKTGVSGQPLTVNGASPRASRQVNKFNSEGGDFEARVVAKSDNRSDILGWERQNAERLRREGNSMTKHKRP